MRTTLDKFGRIVIPKQMRENLGMEPGGQVTVEEHGETIHVRPVHEVSPLVVKEGILIYRGKAEGDLERAMAADRERRLRKLGKGLIK